MIDMDEEEIYYEEEAFAEYVKNRITFDEFLEVMNSIDCDTECLESHTLNYGEWWDCTKETYGVVLYDFLQYPEYGPHYENQEKIELAFKEKGISLDDFYRSDEYAKAVPEF